MGEDVPELADDAVRRNDCQIGLQAVLRTFIDVEDPREVAAAAPDHLRSNRRRNVVLLKVKHRLQPVTLNRVFRESSLLQPKTGDLLLKIVVLLASVTQVDVVGPAMAEVIAKAMEETLKRRDGRDGPVTNQSDAAAVGRAGLDRTPNLNGEAYRLGEKNRYQNQDIFKTCKE